MNTTTANEQANAPPGTITLGGVQFLVGQPTPQAMTAILVECRKRIKARRAARVLELFREFKDYEFAKQVATDELGQELPATLTEGDGKAALEPLLAEMNDPAMCRFAAFLLLRPGDPTLTAAKLAELITNDNAAAVGIELLMSCGLAQVAPNSTGASGSPSTAQDSTQPHGESSAKDINVLPMSSQAG